MIIPSHLGRGGSQPLPPRTSHPPAYIHNCQNLYVDAVDKNSNLMGVSRGEGAGTLGPASRGSAGGGARMHQLSRGSGTNVLGSPPKPSRGVIITSHLGRGGSLPLHTQWLKTYAREHPLPTYTMAKNAGLRGRGVGASGRGSAGLLELKAHMHQQSRGA